MECPNCFRGSVIYTDYMGCVGEELEVVCCLRCGGSGQIDEQAEYNAYLDSQAQSDEEDRLAELRNEAWFEERGHYGRDYHEEELWQYDRQIGGW